MLSSLDESHAWNFNKNAMSSLKNFCFWTICFSFIANSNLLWYSILHNKFWLNDKFHNSKIIVGCKMKIHYNFCSIYKCCNLHFRFHFEVALLVSQSKVKNAFWLALYANLHQWSEMIMRQKFHHDSIFQHKSKLAIEIFGWNKKVRFHLRCVHNLFLTKLFWHFWAILCRNNVFHSFINCCNQVMHFGFWII